MKILELKKYSDRIKDNVEKLNEFTTGSIEIPIKQVAYRFNLDTEEMYLDYPYNENVELQNEALNDVNSNIYNIDDKLFKYFSSNYEESELNYILYRFQYAHDQPIIKDINSSISEFEKKEKIETIRKAFSIIHYNSTSKGSYLDDITYQKDNNIKNIDSHCLLFVFDKFNVDCALTRKNKLSYLNVTFELDKILDFESVETKKTIKHLIYNLRLFGETLLIRPLSIANRKSYILSFQHNLGNLYLGQDIKNLSYIKDSIMHDNSVILDGVIKSLNIVKLTHSFLFDYERLEAGFEEDSLELKDKKIEDLFNEYYFKCYPDYETITNFIGTSQYKLESKDNENNYMMIDVSIVLWNLWTNACKSVTQENPTINIAINECKESVMVSIENFKSMSNDMINYIKGLTEVHPNKKAGRPLRGWNIIKDIQENNKRLEIYPEFSIESTKINLKISKR